MSAQLSLMTAILKEFYIGPLRNQINMASPVYQRVKRNSLDVSGVEAWIPLKKAHSQAIGSRAELGPLPTAKQVKTKEAKVPLKNFYGVMRVSGPSIKATRNDRGAFVKIIDLEATGMKEGMTIDFNRQFYGTARGDIAKTGVTSASLTVVLASDANMELFVEDMNIDIFNSGETIITNGNSRTIEAIDKTAKTLLLILLGVS